MLSKYCFTLRSFLGSGWPIHPKRTARDRFDIDAERSSCNRAVGGFSHPPGEPPYEVTLRSKRAKVVVGTCFFDDWCWSQPAARTSCSAAIASSSPLRRGRSTAKFDSSAAQTYGRIDVIFNTPA
jgi:hypothetical protein